MKRSEPAGPPAAKSVAVLPFVDLSPGESQEHIADGIADILINSLNRIEGLRVPGRTSAFYFKGKDVTPGEIGQKLNVEWLLEGSVQVEGSRLRVAANLLRAADGTTLWAERYDRAQSDIFAVEDEIALSVLKALQVKLSSTARSQLINRGTENPEAYNLFVKGKHLSIKGRTFTRQAIESYEQAIEKDPNFAFAYSSIAACYYTLGSIGLIGAHEANAKAKAAALKALEIDSSLADAPRILACIKMTYEWDFAGAEQDIKKAIGQDPNNRAYHATYADLLSALGRHEEALKEANLANDPPLFHPGFLGAVTMYTHWRGRKYDLALEGLKKALELDPYHATNHINLIAVYLAMGRYEEARETNDRRREIMGFSQSADDRATAARDDEIWSALIYASSGHPVEARRILAGLKAKMKETYVSPVLLAEIHAALGDKDEAFAWLEKAYHDRAAYLYALKVDPPFDPLRDDPRFTALLRRIGLEK